MKKLLSIIPLLFAISCVRAADVKFAWDYATPMPSGFEMRIMDSSGVVIQTYNCGASTTKSCKVPSITPGARQAQCFAYNIGDPSDIPLEYSTGSNIVAFTVPVKPAAPTGAKVSDNQSASFKIESQDPMVIQLTFSQNPSK